MSPYGLVLRAALAIGCAVDLYVALLGLFAPQLIQPLLDIPLRDPLFAQVAGGEFLVAAAVYAVTLRDPERFRPLLWVCALDQLLAVILPWLAVAHGAVPASWKVVAPIPIQACFALLFAAAASRAGTITRPIR